MSFHMTSVALIFCTPGCPIWGVFARIFLTKWLFCLLLFAFFLRLGIVGLYWDEIGASLLFGYLLLWFYCREGDQISPLIFDPDLPFSDSSITILKVFAYWYLSVSGLETSQHNHLLLLGESVKFCPRFLPQILPFSDSSITVLKAFTY